jgi:hypothetical protein
MSTPITRPDGTVVGWIEGAPSVFDGTAPRMTHFGFLSRLTP